MKYNVFEQIVNTFYNDEIENIIDTTEKRKDKGNIKIEPKIIYDRFTGDLKIEFSIGKQKMYKITNLSEFYIRMLNKEKYKYGPKLEFIHEKEEFEESSQKLLEFILKYAEIIKYANSNSNPNYRFYGKAFNEEHVILSNSGLDDIFEILKNEKISFEKDKVVQIVEFVPENPKIEFKVEKINEQEYKLQPSIDLYKINIINGRDFTYFLNEEKLYRCDRKYKETVLKLLNMFRNNYSKEIIFGKEQLPQIFSIIIPKMQGSINIEKLEENEIEKYKPKPLEIKVYLDFDKNNYVVADIRFKYGDEEFNPLEEKIHIQSARNMIEETKALNAFRTTGFMLDTKNLRFILPDNDNIYEFLSNDINYYMQKFDVLATDRFNNKDIIKPKISNIGVKIENNLLSIDLKTLNIDVNELKDILEKYNLKKKYHRLKDGSFLELQENNDIDFLNKLINGMEISYKDLEKGEIKLPTYRTLYLDQLLKKLNNKEITKNSEYKDVVNNLSEEYIKDNIEVPKNLENTLRYYQKIGFKWLKTLDNYDFGGILADDMGLGKTIQVITMFSEYVEKNKENKKTSLVVAPSSLTLNWKNEINKFTSNVTCTVIHGNLNERKTQIENFEQYDVVITSYDLLKRDIDLYKNKDYEFRFIIADEAQYLKNSNTQNAKSIKEIKAKTRYALTGTPIENSLAELWSIFDYIMPGYLFSYRKFKNLYEMPIIKDNNVEAMNRLKMLIKPFILRRTKKEVLTELPEKTVTILNNQMQEEQEEIYLSYLARAKQEVAEMMDLNGYEKSKIQILALLTRLRQICCHPGLFLENYKGESSKLEQCMEIVEEAVNAGHKILLFSGYTSMFEIIEQNLKEKNIKYLQLTGSTKVDERIKLVDEFNENKEIKVFLISLKAGGTGLNLTGADMVIHYDPWWNSSAENQATDRAYRIGQKNNVQVYKLITKNSIEEKIYELQQKKSELIDNMLDTETTFISKLSKEDKKRKE